MTKFFKLSCKAYWSLRPEMEAEDFQSVNRLMGNCVITYVKQYRGNYLCKVVKEYQYAYHFLHQGKGI